MIRLLAPALLVLTAAAPPAPSPAYNRAIAAGYKALTYCSAIFNAGRTPAQIDADELRGIYPEYDAIVPTMAAVIERHQYTSRVTVRFDAVLPPRAATWEMRSGCTLAPVGAMPALRDLADRAAPRPLFVANNSPWPAGDSGIPSTQSKALASVLEGGFDGKTFGPGSKTVSAMIVRDGQIVAERYRAGFGLFTANRTWSVAKSITGTLIGAARLNAAAKAGSPTTPVLDPRLPAAIPQWQPPQGSRRLPTDPRGAITLDNLLRMASGLHSDTAGNRTDSIYFGGAAVDEQIPGWSLEAKPGTRFRYANDDILLAAYAFSNEAKVRHHTLYPRGFFERLGMYHTVAERDWHGNYVLSSQVWSTARDLARLGQFWLQDGVWQGERLLPKGWVKYMTTPSGPQPAEGPGYGATMWLFGPKQGLPAGTYAALGNRGQSVMVVPSERLVIVRRGEDPGTARFDIAAFTRRVIEAGR